MILQQTFNQIKEEYDFNDFFRNLKGYCKGFRQEDYVPSRNALELDKKKIIIFEADLDKIDLSIQSNNFKELVIPTDKIFIEIPKWIINYRGKELINQGGILIYEELFGERKVIMAKTFWVHEDSKRGITFTKPISTMFLDSITNKEQEALDKNNWKVGSCWGNPNTIIQEEISGIDDELKKTIASTISKIVISILSKIEKKEYTTYKKWKPIGLETKKITYCSEVSRHKRHFWKDTKRFKIPLMGREEWEKEGYGTDEVVYKDGKLVRDVPFRVIGNYLVGEEKNIEKKNNKRIEIAKGKIWKNEKKLYDILRQIFPEDFIKKHDRKAVKPLELDFYIRELKLAFEYDGEQHFDRNLCEDVFKSDFDELQKRDKKKDHFCRNKNITLIRIKFDEPLNKKHIRKRIREREIEC